MEKLRKIIVHDGDFDLDDVVALSILLAVFPPDVKAECVVAKSSVSLDDVDADTILLKVDVDPTDAPKLTHRVLQNTEEVWKKYGAKIIKPRQKRKEFYQKFVLGIFDKPEFFEDVMQIAEDYYNAETQRCAKATEEFEDDPIQLDACDVMISPLELVANWLALVFCCRVGY